MRPSKYAVSKFNKTCVACGLVMAKPTREHYFPKWLIERTNTIHEGIAWGGKPNVSALAATVPLCQRCNFDFGRELESPMAAIFDDIEASRGLSDYEAELVVRWMWKFEGLAWRFRHPRDVYSVKYTLRDRVLNPLDEIRGRLTLAIALTERRDPDFLEGAMGIDSWNVHNAIFVSGVFSRVAIVVCLTELSDELPAPFSKYPLAAHRLDSGTDAKLFHPAIGFPTCGDAVGYLRDASPYLSSLHDDLRL
jgi:hypothetical protein